MIIDELFEAPQLCPECGGISFSDLILAEKKDACYHKVKASAKVWPSAYASGRLVQCRKKGAANYGNKSEGVAEEYELAGVGVAYELGRRAYRERKTIRDNPYSATKEARKYDEWEKGLERGKHDANDAKLFRSSVREQGMAEGVMYGAENLNVGDDVIVSGNVEFNGATGVIDSFGQDKRFVVVNLYNHGRHSFHSSDVSANDYDRDEEENDDDLYGRRDDLDEGGNVFMPNIQNTPEYKAGFATGKLPVPHPEGTQQYASYYKGVIDKASPTLSKVGEDDANFGKSAALMTPSPQAAQQAKDIVQQRADANVISQAKMLGAIPQQEGEQQPGADYRDPKEVDYDDEYDAMVARVKKLAGVGPMRTVYDPNKRVYRNMPTAVQPKK